MSRLKTSSSKSAKPSDKTKRRKKKATPASASAASASSSSGARRSASPPPSPLTITAPHASMRSSVSSLSSPSSGTPTASKECEQCGNPAVLELGSNAKALANSKRVAATANSGCQVCDFVAFRKAQRHCVQCDRAQCDVFCEWCGHGFHTKCARARGEQLDNANGFCCKKCEAEQADDDDDETAEANDVNAKCGECHMPFNSTAEAAAAAAAAATAHGKSSKKGEALEADSTGFKVNQSVLVENDEVLYNAVITDVDAKNERIKIHFLRWSKSFDNWYAMDDERINESLACDCCNRWFHIGCLPPIKSSGRFKDTTYVCPTCLDDARGFFAGTRTTVTSLKTSKQASTTTSGLSASSSGSSTATSSSRRKGSNDDDDKPSKKRASKPVVQSESEEEELALEPERLKSKAPARKAATEREKENVANENRSRKRRRADSVDSSGSNGSERNAKPAASPVKKSELKAKAKRRSSPRADEHEHDERDEEDDEEETKTEPKDAHYGAGDDHEGKAPLPDAAALDAGAKHDPAKPSSPGDTPGQAEDAAKPSEHVAPSEAELSMDKPTIKRKVSGHSVSSLLNSPSSPPRHASPAAAPVRVKVEKDPLALPAPPAKKASRAKVWVTGRDAKTAKAAAAAAAASASSSASSSNRNSLSAFDILREVAAQSMSDEIDAPQAPVAARRTQKARAPPLSKNSSVKHENDKLNGRTPPLATSSGAASSTTPLGVGIPMNSYVDLHFAIRKEMYLRICMLEDERLLERETAQLLRSMIYPTSDKFHDLKFVYVVNKDLSSLQLTKRLLELVPITSGGTAPVIPMRPSLGTMQLPHPPPSLVAGSGSSSSAAPSPARPSNASPAPPGYQTPVRSASPAIESTSSNAIQPEPEPHVAPPHKMFQLPSSIGFASAVDRPRASGASSSSVLTSTISPSSAVGPPMPPPLSTKLLLETMHKHSKFPTLLPPPLPSSSLSTPSSSSSCSKASTTTLPASSCSSLTPSTATASSVASVVAKPSPERPASLVNNISASISSN